MAEERIVPKHEEPDFLSRDDVSALGYVLQHVRGASPSSMQLTTAYDEVES